MSWRPEPTDWRGSARKRHMVKWDPRPDWKRACEWPLRKFYLINYDPFIWVPEEELIWDQPVYNEAREGRLALALLFAFFAAILVAIWIMSFIFQ